MNRKILLPLSSATFFLLAACSQETSQPADANTNGDMSISESASLSCTTKNLADKSGIKIICDGDSIGVVYNGKNGTNGKDGKDGKDGVDGIDGVDGRDGRNGAEGASCTIEPIEGTDSHKVLCDGDSVGVLYNGENGSDGKTAYEIAVDNGFNGTEEEWLASLKGEKGDKGETGATGEKGDKGDTGEKGDKEDAGDDGKNGVDGTNGTNGKSAYQIAVDNGFEGTEEEWLASLKGEKGDDGDDGAACYITDNSEINGFNVYCGGVLVGTLQNGADGKNGTNGAGCTATTTRDESTDLDGIMVQCGNNAPVYVWNGANGTDGGDGNDGLGCSSTTTTDAETGLSGVIVQCGTSDPVTIWDGKDGEDGSDGEDGENGTSCTAEANEEINGYDIICNNVKVGEIKNGKDGKDGENGTGGTSGSSCTAEAVTDSESGRTGVAITCGTNEPVIVWNGKDGKDAEAASSSSSDESSSSIEESSSSEEVLSEACLEMRATKTAFFPIQDVFGCVKSNEKVVFIVRHAERNKDDTGSEKSLNSNGFSQANYVGQNIGALNLSEDIYYWHTNSRRTMETASRISRGAGEIDFFDESTFGNCNGSDKGKNENANCINEHHEYNNKMTGSWFDKCDGEGDDWKTYAKAAYEPEKCWNSTKPDVVARTNDFVKTYIKDKFDDLHKYTIAISHDQFLVSAVAAISNRQIDFKFHEHGWNQTGFMHWPNYLAGFAVIINESKDVVYIPVRGLNSGFFGDHCKTGSEVGYPCSVWP